MASFMTGRAKLFVGLAGVGALVGAFFLLRGDDEAKGGAKDEAAQPDRDVPTASGDPKHARNLPPRGSQDGDEPRQPEVRDMADGTSVVDHRKNPGDYIRPGVPHPSISELDGPTNVAVMRQVRPILLACLKDIPTEAMAEDAVVMMYAVVSIDDAGRLTASELGGDSMGIDSPKLDAAMQCLAAGAPQVALDTDHFAVQDQRLSMRVEPRKFR